MLLEVKSLCTEFPVKRGVVRAVDDVSFEVSEGEILAIVGESGSGKSVTSLSVMGLLAEPGHVAGGEMTFDGKDLVHLSEKEYREMRGNDMAMIFQEPMTSLNPILPVGQQIGEAVLLHTDLNKEEREKRVDEMLTAVGLQPSRKNEYPHQFSGGMKQRIVIAIALACNPELLLADEPTTALDVTIQSQVLQMMNDLKKRFNTGMILITHDLGVVAQTCDKVAIMYAGHIVENGTVQDIYESAQHHPYTVGLFHSIPEMNKDSNRLAPIPGLMPDPMIRQEGCSFSDRCPKCSERCRREKPGNYTVSNSHTISCFLYEQGDADKEEI